MAVVTINVTAEGVISVVGPAQPTIAVDYPVASSITVQASGPPGPAGPPGVGEGSPYDSVPASVAATGWAGSVVLYARGDHVHPGVPNAHLTDQNAHPHAHPDIYRSEWNYDTNTTIADPGSGDVRTNGTGVGDTTIVALSRLSADGIDVSSLVLQLTTDDMIAFQEADDAANWGRVRVTGAPTAFLGWISIPVEHIESYGSAIAKNQRVVLQFTYGGAGGGGGAGAVSSVNAQTGDVVLGAADVGADASGTAAAAIVAHEAALDPHGQYLTASELVAGDSIDLDTTTTPGSVIIGAKGILSGAMHQDEFIWEASPSTPPMATANAGVDTELVSESTELYLNAVSVNGVDWGFIIQEMDTRWEVYAQDLDNHLSWHRWGLTEAPTLSGSTWTLPVETIAGSPQGTEPNDNARILIGFIAPAVTSHANLDDLGAPADDHPQYHTDARHALIDHAGIPGVGGGGSVAKYFGAAVNEPDPASYDLWVVTS